jgi:hypothetical protein
MTTADAVRGWLGPGRLLPLGRAGDGAWLTERAARRVLLAAAARVPGVAPGAVRVELAAPETAGEPVVPPPPGALPPGPLRIAMEFAAGGALPLPETADALRRALYPVAADTLGLVVAEVDLRVTALLADGEPAPGAGREPGPPEGVEPADPLAEAVAALPGVARLTSVLGPPVFRAADRVRVECAVAPGHRPPAVAGAVRETVAGLLGQGPPVAVLVTAVGD